MQLNRLLAFAGAAASITALLSSALAQAPGTARPGTMPHQPSHMTGMMRPRMGTGQIIGNKNTKVYHLPGEKGMMPAEKNRVYFRTEREAMAAGYHLAKVGGKSKMGKPATHSMGTMRPGLPK